MGSAVSAQLTADRYYTLQCGALPPLKIAPSHGDLDPIKYIIPWAHPSPQPNGISIGSVVFVALTTVTDRQTD